MRALALILGLLCAAPSWAALYATNAGAGSRNGTSLTNACQGLTDADCTSSAATGETIYLCDDFTQASSWALNVSTRLAFDGDKDVCGRAADGSITMTGGSFNLNWTGSGTGTFRNIVFNGGGASDCINIDGSGRVILEDNEIRNCNEDGIDVDATTATVSIRGNYLHDIVGTPIIGGAAGTPGPMEVLYNEIDNFGTAGTGTNADGIGIANGVPSSVVYGNIVRRNRSDVGGGIDIQDATSAATVIHRVAGNFVECGPANTNGSGLTSTGTASALFVGNVVTDCVNPIFAKGTDASAQQTYYNNSLFNARGAAIKIAGVALGAARNVTLRNNLVVNAAAQYISVDVSGSTYTSDYNAFFGGTGFKDVTAGAPCLTLCTLAEWQALTNDANSLESDPLLSGGADPSAAVDACPRAGSPLLGAGTPLGAFVTGYGNEDLGNPAVIGARRACEFRRAVTGRRVVVERRAP